MGVTKDGITSDPSAKKILVPLCGKSKDLVLWLLLLLLLNNSYSFDINLESLIILYEPLISRPRFTFTHWATQWWAAREWSRFVCLFVCFLFFNCFLLGLHRVLQWKQHRVLKESHRGGGRHSVHSEWRSYQDPASYSCLSSCSSTFPSSRRMVGYGCTSVTSSPSHQVRIFK